MNILKLSSLLALLFCFTLLAQAQNTADDVVVLHEYQSEPTNATYIGDIKHGYGALKMHCNCRTILQEAKEDAASKGANLIKITSFKLPGKLNSCYRLKGEIFKVSDIAFYKNFTKKWNDSVQNSIVPTNAPYAMVYFFRRKEAASDLYYNVKMNDKVVYEASSNTIDSIKIYEEGNVELSASYLYKSTSATLDVKHGHSYFISCYADLEFVTWFPQMEILGPVYGLQQMRGVEADIKKMERTE